LPNEGARPRRLALKVDCDTYEGSRRGIPNLLRLFEDLSVRASFFFTLGPDNSGRAIFRVFTQKGFLRKMLRSRAASLYGPRTMLSGTLLPAPRIGDRLADTIRSAGRAGHEVGVHGWDHVRWHDRLARMSREEIARDYGRAHEKFAEIFGYPARASAAPGWHATAISLEIQEEYGLFYASDTRRGSPFFPRAGERVFGTLQIPTTLPTWDEMLGSRECPTSDALLDFYRKSIRGTEVHSVHTEVEGTAHLELFRRQMTAWREDGIDFVTLEEIAREALSAREHVPVRKIARITLPGRGGEVTASA
jgi:undecaprenyl phosphate-alpha-L-ara4FN deformylase